MSDTSTAPTRPTTADGSAPAGSIRACALYRDGTRCDLSIEAAGAAVNAGHGTVWIGLYEPDETMLCRIQTQFKLHELLIEDVHQAHQRPKLDIYGDVIFLAIRTAQLSGDRIDFGETHLIVGKGFVISIRHGASQPYTSVRARCERSPELMRIGEAFVVYAILDYIADNYFPVLDAIESELEEIESEIFTTTPANEKIERIYRLRVEMQSMRRVVAPMLEICNRLARHEFSATEQAIVPYLHDLHDHAQLVNDAIVDVRERLASAFEASLLLASARQNDIVKKLASWAAILAVPTAIAGIYGMNFKFMPELDWQFGYPTIMLFMLGLCGFLFYRFKRAAWL
ncbi:MAG TPA: magnesium/cobalt transporter CorA [Stellaceae bacterium]|jgi:magnesium transporter|nr:magnesium/cobalt transporter CorA [Stellaceae bacterium]